MALNPYYSTGTVSAAAGGTIVTGTGTSWLAVLSSDFSYEFVKAGFSIPIASVDSNTQITLAEPWPGTALVNSIYRIRFLNPGSALAASVRSAIDGLSNLGLPGSGAADLQLILNKAAAANIASILLRDAQSGRAEFGLTGDDDFHIKVSADGTAWTEALKIARASGLLTVTGDPTSALGVATKQYVDVGSRPAVARQNAPPASPSDAAAYVVGSAGTGAWAGHSNESAVWNAATAAWLFTAPSPGQSVFVKNEYRRYIYGAAAGWVPLVKKWLTSSALFTLLGTAAAPPTLQDYSNVCAAANVGLILDTDEVLGANTTIAVKTKYDGGTIATGAFSLTHSALVIAPDEANLWDAAGTGVITLKNERCSFSWFSPDGGGIASNDKQIVRANACGAKIVAVGAGTFARSTAVIGANNMRWKGLGNRVSIFKKLTSTGHVNLDNVSDFAISDIGFDGNRGVVTAWNFGAVGSVNGGTRRALLHRVRVFNDASDAIAFIATAANPSDGIRILDCEYDTIGAHGIITQGYCNNVWILRNRGKDVSLTTLHRGHITASRFAANVFIRDNVLDQTVPEAVGSVGYFISLDTVTGATAEGNTIDGHNVSVNLGIEMGITRGCTIVNNSIRNLSQQAGIHFSGQSLTAADAAINVVTNDKLLTSASSAFSDAHIGTWVSVTGAGAAGQTLVARIASVAAPTQVLLDRAAAATVSAATLKWAQINVDSRVGNNSIFNCAQGIVFAVTGFSQVTRSRSDFTATVGSKTVSSPTFGFTRDDVEQGITVTGAGAGGATLTAVVQAIAADGLSATLDRAAGTSVAGTGTANVNTFVGFHMGCSVTGNDIANVSDIGLWTDLLGQGEVCGNRIQNGNRFGILAERINQVNLAGNRVSQCNKNGTDAAGFAVRLQTAIGLDAVVWNNRSLGNNTGGGGASDFQLTVDGVLADNPGGKPILTSTSIIPAREDELSLGDPFARFKVHSTWLQHKTYTVAGLPAGVSGMRAFVSDAAAPAWGAAVAGGGAVKTPVYYDGAWKAG